MMEDALLATAGSLLLSLLKIALACAIIAATLVALSSLASPTATGAAPARRGRDEPDASDLRTQMASNSAKIHALHDAVDGMAAQRNAADATHVKTLTDLAARMAAVDVRIEVALKSATNMYAIPLTALKRQVASIETAQTILDARLAAALSHGNTAVARVEARCMGFDKAAATNDAFRAEFGGHVRALEAKIDAMSTALSALQSQQGMPVLSVSAKPTATTPPGFEESKPATPSPPLERSPLRTTPAFTSSLRRSLEDDSEDENEVDLPTATGSVHQRGAKPKKGHRGRSANAIARRNAISMSRLVAKHMAEHVLE
ncbi:hypothetical protein SDRG_01360 [Saprolegnia diclina VS20]|uniref:Uncharacterized protein n=1 Tax=Saprolegnia diclina (strain VS20) TaxID=1156394 RepID=T0QT85_SAPDV|nr:hypothetical protein SDRG_01360 [Saprolegnia diclina VS20]EQC41389.1 hypothetical protein SDRG_01360 [Saprolegnia diclina VS20]|eukprot:XP_008605103.1 hypothetical protein SDRG_01360 [Saprolegnia diclina VS20]